MKQLGMSMMLAGIVAAVAGTARAADQTWVDGGLNNFWSLSDANWDSSAVWANGNSAVFSGTGGVVEVAGDISVTDLAFQANGYEVADANADGTLTLSGAPSVLTVANVGAVAKVSEVLGGSGGFTKTGAGLLQLTGANTYSNVTRVSAGVLRLENNVPSALGAAGEGNETVVEDGATLDFNGAYWWSWSAAANNVNEDVIVSGAGADGNGALINTGNWIMNGGFRNLTLLGDTVLGGNGRLDLNGEGSFTGNGFTLTKSGGFEFAVTRAMNGSPIVINGGSITIQHPEALGGTTPGDTIVNGGELHCWGTRTIPERVVFNGGSIRANWNSDTFTLTGHLTLNSVVGLYTSSGGGTKSTIEFAGLLDGPGGLSVWDGVQVYLLGDDITYSGTTTINGGNALHVGREGGVPGRLGSGAVMNDGDLFLDRTGSYALPSPLLGSGHTFIRYDGDVTLSGGASTNSWVCVADGAFTMTNGASLSLPDCLRVSERIDAGYAADPLSVTATVNIHAGSELVANYIVIGNGFVADGGSMVGTINQYGGAVWTTGATAENNGLRLGHWPQANGVYNMMGGTLTIGGDYELNIATDGQGWLHLTGGEVYAARVDVNEREGGGGYGRLTVAGGVLNVGTLSGLVAETFNSIWADAGAPYLVEYGGSGGTVRAVTNIYSALDATLFGTGAEAITFDSSTYAISLSGNLTGEGGLNKAGAGVLTLSGANTYGGATRVLAGTLTPVSAGALPSGGQVLFGVAADDAGGRLHVPGDLSLAGLIVGVANAEALDRSKSYTIATYGGALTGLAGGDVLPEPWYVFYDEGSKRVQIKAAIGTLIRLR